MSMIACDMCSRLIDSDDDPDCFEGHHVICEKCRDEIAREKLDAPDTDPDDIYNERPIQEDYQ